MDSMRLKTKELQSKMYLTQTQTQTHRLRLIDSLDSQKRSTRCDLYHAILLSDCAETKEMICESVVYMYEPTQNSLVPFFQSVQIFYKVYSLSF